MTDRHNEHRTIEDPELIAWLSADSDEERELIVEARLPQRRLTFRRRDRGDAIPSGMKGGSPAERTETLEELDRFLAEMLDFPTKVLTAAGAIVVRANSRQVQRFMDHPSVKAVRFNRRLR